MSTSSTSDSDDNSYQSTASIRRVLHSIVGRGQVADVLLWKNTRLSTSILLGVTIIWYLFEVIEYNFVSLLCHIAILVMVIICVTYTTAKFTQWDLPDFDEITIQESAFRWLYKKTNRLLLKFYEISSGQNITRFFMTMAFLWIISVIGNYFSSLNLLYLCFLCIGTLPALYERYENEVEYLVSKGLKDARKMLKQFDSNVLSKIPRGNVKEKKRR